MKSPLEQFDIINVKIINYCGLDLSFNSVIVPFWVLLLIIVIYIIFAYNYKSQLLIGSYLHYIMESSYLFIANVINQQTKKYGLQWFPLIYTLFVFILVMNFMSLIPFGIALTSNLILIFWLSSSICISIFLIGLLRFNLKFLYIFIPQSPFILLPILIPIEIFSYIIRLFSLSIRLAANILAGHTLVHIIVTFILNLIKSDIIISTIFVIPLFLILLLECGVALLQAYVFTVLICIYLSDTEHLHTH